MPIHFVAARYRDVDAARLRLAALRCRMLARGLPASPIGPGFCPADIAV